MKRNNFKYIFGLTILGLFASCSDDEDATDQRLVKSVVTANATTFNLNEGDAALVTLTTDRPLNVLSNFKLELVSGTGSFRDFTVLDGGDANSETDEETTVDDGYGVIGHKIMMPAYASSVTFDITTLIDYLPEGNETLVFRLYPMGNSRSLVAADSQMITINLANTTLNEVQSELKWSRIVNAHGNFADAEYLGVDNVMHTIDAYDFDLIIDGPVVIADGATGAEPEYAGIAETDPDGDYSFFIDLFDAPRGVTSSVGGGYKPKRLLLLKPVLTISKPGVWVKEIVLSGIWDSNVLGSATGDGIYTYAGYVEKAGTTFTLYDANDDELATGRTAGRTHVRPANSRR